jgi:hypothetical protein
MVRLTLHGSANTWKVKDSRLLECYTVLTNRYRRFGYFNASIWPAELWHSELRHWKTPNKLDVGFHT